MITWQGLGFLVVLTWLGPLVPVWIFTDRALLWPSIIGQTVSAVLTYSVGRLLNKKEIRHYFCGVRFEYWGFIMPAIACVISALDLLLSKH